MTATSHHRNTLLSAAAAAGLRACVAALAMGFGGAAGAAELTFTPYAAGQYSYDSNVYKFSSQVAQVTGTSKTADHIQRYVAGLAAAYELQRQKLHASLEGRHLAFQNFKQLNHNEYAFEAGFDGGILSNTTGLLDFRDERRMASFEDRRSTQLIIERDQLGHGGLSYAVTPQWHVVTGARGRNLRSPLPAAPALPQPPPGSPARPASPNFGMHEAAFNAGVQYGIDSKDHPEAEAPLLAGVMLEYQTVSFSGVTPQPAPPPPPPPPLPILPPPAAQPAPAEQFGDYNLLSLQAVAKYVVNGLSNFDGKLGLTQYRPRHSGGQSKPDVLGEFGYTRGWSALTELNVHVFRRIMPFVATAEATTDTGISVGAVWEPRVDLTVLGNYSWATSSFKGNSGVSPDNAGRHDKVQYAMLSVSYPLSRLLALRAFGTYANRRSNLAYDSFSDQIYGLELSFRWK